MEAFSRPAATRAVSTPRNSSSAGTSQKARFASSNAGIATARESAREKTRAAASTRSSGAPDEASAARIKAAFLLPTAFPSAALSPSDSPSASESASATLRSETSKTQSDEIVRRLLTARVKTSVISAPPSSPKHSTPVCKISLNAPSAEGRYTFSL